MKAGGQNRHRGKGRTRRNNPVKLRLVSSSITSGPSSTGRRTISFPPSILCRGRTGATPLPRPQGGDGPSACGSPLYPQADGSFGYGPKFSGATAVGPAIVHGSAYNCSPTSNTPVVLVKPQLPSVVTSRRMRGGPRVPSPLGRAGREPPPPLPGLATGPGRDGRFQVRSAPCQSQPRAKLSPEPVGP